MTIRANTQCTRPNEELLDLGGLAMPACRVCVGAYHHLVADPIARGEKSDPVFFGKCLDQIVFTEIGFVLQLNLVIKRKDWLRRVLDSRGVHRPVLVSQVIQIAIQSMIRLKTQLVGGGVLT